MSNRNDYITPVDSMDGDFHGGGIGQASAEEGDSDRSNDGESQTQNNDAGGSGSRSRTRNDNGSQEQDEEEDDNESNLLFSCQCDSARTIATLLSCLRRVVTAGGPGSSSSNFSGSGGGGGNTQSATQRGTQSTSVMALSGASANKIQHATVYAGPNGLTFHVQHGLAKQSQCSVDMPKGLFREYFVGEEEVWLEDSDVESEHDDEGSAAAGGNGGTQRGGGTKEIIQGGEFGVNLTTVLECFSILSKTGNKPSVAAPGSGGASGGSGSKAHLGEYASLSNVPLCMSYDRGTATFHLEFLEGGSLSSTGGEAATNVGGGGCLVTCEVPGVAVADDVDEGPDDDTNAHNSINTNNNSGLASAFRSSPLLSRAILYSDALQSAVSELYDVPGASIVQVSLSSKGIELGTVGPRSECWVDVPYHRGQGGMYVGLECYKPNVPLFGVADGNNNIIRRYPLGAFLSGMRGLDIGVETCISVNARGMMAIQHQVSRDGYYDFSEESNGGNVRPSFVDFIMTCIEEEHDENDGSTMVSQDNASVQMSQHQYEEHNGLQDITNNGSTDVEDDVGSKGRKKKSREAVARVARTMAGRGRAAARDEPSSPEEEEDRRPAKKAGRRGKYHDDSAEREEDFGGNDNDVHFDQEEDNDQIADNDNTAPTPKRSSKNDDATSRILGELEMDTDMLSSRRDEADALGRGRKNALEDIRRRRQERLQHHQSPEMQKSDEQSEDDNSDNDDRPRKSHVSSGNRKRRAKSSRAGSRKASRNSEEENEYTNRGFDQSDDDNEMNSRSQSKHLTKRQHSNPAQDSQSQSDDDDEDDESDHEDSLDVTAEIPLLFSKRSSLSTSRHSRGGTHRSSSRGSNGRYSRGSMNDDDDNDASDEEQEPRMMYGDTKLEFTQDGYESD